MRGLPSASEKPRFVAAMFGRIAARYDLMNTFMTLGQDGLWRRRVARSLGAPSTVLDVGTGTPKLAEAISHHHPPARGYCGDFPLPLVPARPAPPELAA